MKDSHFICVALNDATGYSWTLTTRLGHMLREVEQHYGGRDKSWTVLGVEFGPTHPQTWYPGNCNAVAIQLSAAALDHTALACYELAHECVHLLAPGGTPPAPVLEEGLATLFSEDYVLREFGATNYTSMYSYARAAALTRELLAIDAHAIRKLRELRPAFRDIVPETFRSAGIDAPLSLISKLLLPFDRSQLLPKSGHTNPDTDALRPGG